MPTEKVSSDASADKLAEFLHARLDEDEAHIEDEPMMKTFNAEIEIVTTVRWMNLGRRMEEVFVKRRILDELRPIPGNASHNELADRVMRLLALPYCTHPDYREEWKP